MEFEQEKEKEDEEAAVKFVDGNEFVKVKLFDSSSASDHSDESSCTTTTTTTTTTTDLNNYTNTNNHLLLLHQDSTGMENSSSTNNTTNIAGIIKQYDKLLATQAVKLSKTQQQELLALRKQLDQSKKQLELCSTLVKILCNYISTTLKVDVFDKAGTTNSLDECINKIDWAEIGRISRLLLSTTTCLSLSTTSTTTTTTTDTTHKSQDNLNVVIKEKQQQTVKNKRKGDDRDQDQESQQQHEAQILDDDEENGGGEGDEGENWDYDHHHQYHDFIEAQQEQEQVTYKIDTNDYLGSTCLGIYSKSSRPRRSCTTNSPYSISTTTIIPSSCNQNQKSFSTMSKKRKIADPTNDPSADYKVAAAAARSRKIKYKPLPKQPEVGHVQEEDVALLRNPDFIQLDADPPQTIKRRTIIKKSADNNNTEEEEQVVEEEVEVEEEIDATSLYTAATQIPVIIQGRETYFKAQAKELYKAYFEPIYDNTTDGDAVEEGVEIDINNVKKIIGHQCKLCQATLGSKPSTRSEFCRHLALDHHEVTRSKFQLKFPNVSCFGRQLTNVWSHFITLKIGYRFLDSFCKKCHRRIKSPKTYNLVYHLECCGGWDEEEENGEEAREGDGFWENVATSRLQKQKKNHEDYEKWKKRVQSQGMRTKDESLKSAVMGIDDNQAKEEGSSKKQGGGGRGGEKIIPPSLMSMLCEVCGQLIRKGSGGALKKHMVTHSKKRPFKCPQCPYAAKYQFYLKQHDLVKHQGVKLVRKNPPIKQRGRKRPAPIINDESD